MITLFPFAIAKPALGHKRGLSFSRHLAAALHGFVPPMPGFTGWFGRQIWFLPALALAVLVWAVNRTTRYAELVGLVSAGMQSLSSVTSPLKIAVTALTLTAVWLSGSVHPARLGAFIAVGCVAAVSCADVLLLNHVGGMSCLMIWLPPAVVIAISFGWASRAMAKVSSR